MGGGGFRKPWDPSDQEIFPMRLNELGTCPDTEPPGHKPLVINKVVVGPFEMEEEETGVASDVVKVEGEDPGTPGPLIQRMTPGPQRFPNIRVNKTKQHTHTRQAHNTLRRESSWTNLD